MVSCGESVAILSIQSRRQAGRVVDSHAVDPPEEGSWCKFVCGGLSECGVVKRVIKGTGGVR